MKRPRLNTALLGRIADAIEANPALYDSTTYGYPTPQGMQHCIAGWAAALSGCEPAGKDYVHHLDGRVYTHWGHIYPPRSGARAVTAEWARKKLGLTWEEGRELLDAKWAPPAGQSVPDYLRAMGVKR